MNRLHLHAHCGWRQACGTIAVLFSLIATNGCVVWDWVRPAANPDAAAPMASHRNANTGAASGRAKGTLGDHGDAEDGAGSSDSESGQIVSAEEDSPELATRFRPRAPRRSENLLLDERSRQIERNLGL
ncbi:MAG: hypothetical protein ACKO38_21350 [Planctomycetota bacterium]